MMDFNREEALQECENTQKVEWGVTRTSIG
jgi:hypothetical protein